jgi:hypothetical protein
MRTEEAIMRDVALLSDEERSPREIAKSLDIMERERQIGRASVDLAAAKALVELKARRGELLPK